MNVRPIRISHIKFGCIIVFIALTYFGCSRVDGTSRTSFMTAYQYLCRIYGLKPLSVEQLFSHRTKDNDNNIEDIDLAGMCDVINADHRLHAELRETLNIAGLNSKERLLAKLKSNLFALLGPADDDRENIAMITSTGKMSWEPLPAISQLISESAILVRPLEISDKEGVPALWVVNDEVQVDEVKNRSHQRRFVTLFNTSPRRLSIKDIKFNCSCASPLHIPEAIEPYGCATVSIALDLFGRKPGALDLQMLARTNDPESKFEAYVWPLKGRIVSTKGFDPPLLSLSSIAQDEGPKDVTATLYTDADNTDEINAVYLDPSIELKGINKDEKGKYLLFFRFEIHRAAIDDKGRFSSTAIFKSGKDGQLNDLQITGYSAAAYNIYPNMLYAGKSEPQSHVGINALLQGPNARRCTVTASSPGVEASCNDGVISCKYETPASPGFYKKTIVVSDSHDYRKLEVVGEVK